MPKLLSGPGFFRICLAILVYLSHVSSLRLGVAAVYVFFSLSGFWISRLWTVKYSRSSRAWRIFVISRFWRLWPVFITSMALSWGLFLLATHGWAPFGFSYIFFKADYLHQLISNTVMFGYATLPFPAQLIRPMWSLDIEAQFYLIAPVVLVLLVRGRLVIAALVALSLAFLLAGHAYVLPRYLIFFMAGILAEKSKWAPGAKLAVAALAAAILLVAATALIPAMHGITLQPRDDEGFDAAGRYNHLLSAALAVIILPWTIFTTRQRGWEHDGVLADLSFIFYAFHYPFLRFFNIDHATPESLTLSLGCTAATCAVVWLGDHALQKRRSAWVSRQVAAYPRVARSERAGLAKIPSPAA